MRLAACGQIDGLCVVGGSRHVSTTASPVDVVVFANLELVVGILGLDQESVSTEVITLGLEKVGRQILGAVTVEEGQSSAEGRHGNTGFDGVSNDVSPAFLGLMDSLVEEIVEKKILKIRIGAVGRGDVL